MADLALSAQLSTAPTSVVVEAALPQVVAVQAGSGMPGPPGPQGEPGPPGPPGDPGRDAPPPKFDVDSNGYLYLIWQ